MEIVDVCVCDIKLVSIEVAVVCSVVVMVEEVTRELTEIDVVMIVDTSMIVDVKKSVFVPTMVLVVDSIDVRVASIVSVVEIRVV